MKPNNNTSQHSVRVTKRLWCAYRVHRREMGSNASEGVRHHMIEELRSAGKLSEDLLKPDAPDA